MATLSEKDSMYLQPFLSYNFVQVAIHRSTLLETPKKISGGLLCRSF